MAKNRTKAEDVRREARSRAAVAASRKPNPFWDTVNLAEKVRLPKPHLTQSDLVAQIEQGMSEMDAAGRVSAFRQVLAGVVEGRFSQYSVLPFGHFSVTDVEEDGETVLNKDGSTRTRNRTPEARRLMAVIDAIIVEMPEDSSYRRLNDAYADAVASIRDEETGKVDESRLTSAILEADKAKQPFWTDSREFIQNGEVSESSLSLADLALAGVLSVTKTDRGSLKVFVAGGKYLSQAISNLAEAGFEDAATLLRERTQRRSVPTKIGSGLSALADLGAKTSSDSESQEDDGDES